MAGTDTQASDTIRIAVVADNQNAGGREAANPELGAAAERLRLTVPQMSRHGIPATPQNYAIWYAYVGGDNPALSAEIDRLIAEGQSFTAVINTQLYRDFVAEHDIAHVEMVREGLGKVLAEVCGALHAAGDDANTFEGKLGGFAKEIVKKTDFDEVTRLLQVLVVETHTMQVATTKMQTHFEEKSKEIEELQEQLQEERERAVTDPLTGLYNRFALIDYVNAAIIEMPAGDPPSLVMLDIDHFKAINDNHGHLIGDRVIRFVAQSLQKNIKGRDIAARYGGEEFTLLLPSTGSKGAEALANAVRRSVEQAQLVRADSKQPLGRITISAGVATYQLGEDMMDLINRADQALYRAKKQGRNCVVVAPPG